MDVAARARAVKASFVRVPVFVVAVGVLAGCGGRSPALEALARATLTAGEGFAAVPLGTPVAAFLDRFPGGRPSVVVGDELGVEMSFADERVSFLFLVDAACRDQVGSRTGELVRAVASSDGLRQAFPACLPAPLASISVGAAAEATNTFFQGVTETGLRLFALKHDAHTAYGNGDDVRGLWLAGSEREDTHLDRLTSARGIVILLGESKDGPTNGRLVVQRMIVFPAQVPAR